MGEYCSQFILSNLHQNMLLNCIFYIEIQFTYYFTVRLKYLLKQNMHITNILNHYKLTLECFKENICTWNNFSYFIFFICPNNFAYLIFERWGVISFRIENIIFVTFRIIITNQLKINILKSVTEKDEIKINKWIIQDFWQVGQKCVPLPPTLIFLMVEWLQLRHFYPCLE